MAPPAPSPFFGQRVVGSLQELVRTVGAGKPGCSRHSPALWVRSGQGGPPWAQAAPRGAAQLSSAVWKHILCPAITVLKSRRVTELANFRVWKWWVDAHCRQDAGRTSSDCGTGAPEGFGKGRSLPDTGCHRDEDSSGNGPAVPGLEAPPATPSRAQGNAEEAGSAMMGLSISTCHCLCPHIPRLNLPW